MNEMLFATSNLGKVRDVRNFFHANNSPYQIVSAVELQSKLSLKDPPDVEETGSTYDENALLKAQAFCEWANGTPTFADDSGLEVLSLDAAPGLYSARYAADECENGKCTFDDNINKLLRVMHGKTDRRAQFVSVIAFVSAAGKKAFFRGVLEGEILTTRRGEGGFGYDPVFYIPEEQKTLAELKELEDYDITTHRTRALSQFAEFVSTNFVS